MDEKEYIERGALLTELERLPHLERSAGSMIRSAPAADVVEVVRCKDCKHCAILYPSKMTGEEPKEIYSCQIEIHGVRPDHFCSYGERRGINHEETGGTAASGDDAEEESGGCGAIS